MNPVAGSIITASTLLKLVVGAVAAGLGVTVAFSLLIFCAERASALRHSGHRAPGLLFQAASLLALAAVMAIVAYGLVLTVGKPK